MVSVRGEKREKMPRSIDADAKYIDGSKLIDFIMGAYPDWCGSPIRGIFDYITTEVENEIEVVPVRHGHWIWHGSYHTCSVCGEEQYGVDTGRFYCQNCGAKMDEWSDDAEKTD